MDTDDEGSFALSSSGGFGSVNQSHFAFRVARFHEAQNTATVPTTLSDDISSTALLLQRGRTIGTMPWERGLMRQVFFPGSPIVPYPNLTLPPLPRVVHEQILVPESAALPTANLRRPLVPFVMRRLRSIDALDDGDMQKSRAISRWRIILELDLNRSEVGRQLVSLLEDGQPDAAVAQSLSDVFSNKKPGTLNKRASSLISYLRWARDPSSMITDILGFSEKDCYNFVNFLRDTGSSPSAAKGFKEALNFAMHVLGMPHLSEAVKSKRISGACSSQLSKKAPLKQAPLYTVDQFRLLHHITCNAPDDRDRCMSGYDLFGTYTSSRFSDAMNPGRVHIDLDEDGVGYIELFTVAHKVATTDERKSIFLPLIAMTPGISLPSWGKSWIEARERTGLKFCDGPTMPAPSSCGGWTRRSMTASEGAQWTRELLAAYGSSQLSKHRITSHTNKATILGWACLFNIDKHFRKLLGHHLESGESSLLTYSRQALEVPLQEVLRMLHAINEGTFDPDSSRLQRLRMVEASRVTKQRTSGSHFVEPDEDYYSRDVYECADTRTEPEEFCEKPFDYEELQEFPNSFPDDRPPINSPAQTSKNSDEENSSSSDSSSSENEVERRVDDDEKAASILSVGAVAKPCQFWDSRGKLVQTVQHNTSGMLHARLTDTRLACNRIMSRSYSAVTKLINQWPKCSGCKAKFPSLPFVQPVAKATPAVPI